MIRATRQTIRPKELSASFALTDEILRDNPSVCINTRLSRALNCLLDKVTNSLDININININLILRRIENIHAQKHYFNVHFIP